MKLKLIPFTIELNKDKFCLTILGFHFKYSEYGLGFLWYKERDVYYTDTIFKLLIWGYRPYWIIKRNYDDIILQHKECNGAVRPETLVCTLCDIYVDYESECNKLTKEDLI